jgi:hypothetical protein
VLVALAALLAAGCGGGAKPRSGGAGASQPRSSPASGQSMASCVSPAASDIERVASIRPSRQEALAESPGVHLRCSTIFIDGSGQLILQVTQADGGPAALTALRRSITGELGSATVRPLPALGAGAFVARRVLAFARSGRLVTLQTGYSAAGRLQLTAAQLARLATIAASQT